MRSILLPVINNEAVVFVDDGEAFSSIQVAVKMSSRKPNYSTILDNLTKVIYYLLNVSVFFTFSLILSFHLPFNFIFQCFEFLHGELDIRFDSGDSFINLLGSGISEEFTDNLIKNCLKENVPSSSADVENFSGIRERVSNFNTYMVGIGEMHQAPLNIFSISIRLTLFFS